MVIAICAASNELKFHILTVGVRANIFLAISSVQVKSVVIARNFPQINKLINKQKQIIEALPRFKIFFFAVINKFYVFVSLINVQSASFAAVVHFLMDFIKRWKSFLSGPENYFIIKSLATLKSN